MGASSSNWSVIRWRKRVSVLWCVWSHMLPRSHDYSIDFSSYHHQNSKLMEPYIDGDTRNHICITFSSSLRGFDGRWSKWPSKRLLVRCSSPCFSIPCKCINANLTDSRDIFVPWIFSLYGVGMVKQFINLACKTEWRNFITVAGISIFQNFPRFLGHRIICNYSSPHIFTSWPYSSQVGTIAYEYISCEVLH